MERRLAAILAADVVGYSRLMGEDEAGTLARFEGLKAEILDPLIAQHRGRVVKLMGDGFLVEFASVVDALACALAWQDTVEARANQVSEERALRFRIGVNLGDVMVKGDDLYGDGVNVAARLEALAAPGSVLVSRTVYDHANGKLAASFEDLGEKQLKNIAKPVQVYRATKAAEIAHVRFDAESGARPRWHATVAGILVLLIAAAGGVLWLQPWAPREQPASVERMAFPLPDKPSIAVLPFTNMSGDPEQEYFADGITDDLITDLSKIAGLFVIARNSTFAYKGRAVQMRQVAEDLGVRYILEGSVRRDGDQVRINAQLIDATTGGHLWAERYDGDMASVFALQDKVTRKIVEALKVSLTEGEQEQIGHSRTTNVAARDAFLNGWERYQRFTPEDMARAVPYFEKAIELDPGYGRAYAALGLVYFRGCQWKWHEPLGVSYVEAFDISSDYLKKAKEHPTSLAHVLASQILLYDRYHEDAFVEAERAVTLDPNDPEAHLVMGWALITTERPSVGVEFVKRAMRINPGYPSHSLLALGTAHFAMGQFAEAATAYKQALDRNPGDIVPLAPLAAAYAHSGRREEAWAAFETWKVAQEKKGKRTSPGSYDFPFKRPLGRAEVLERLTDGLHIADLPAEVTVQTFADALKDEDVGVRRNAARTLGIFGPAASEAVPALIEALKDENLFIRGSVITTLGKIGPTAQEAVPALKEALADRPVRWRVEEALKRITGN